MHGVCVDYLWCHYILLVALLVTSYGMSIRYLCVWSALVPTSLGYRWFLSLARVLSRIITVHHKGRLAL